MPITPATYGLRKLPTLIAGGDFGGGAEKHHLMHNPPSAASLGGFVVSEDGSWLGYLAGSKAAGVEPYKCIKRLGGKVQAKYRHLATGATWSGRGNVLRWLALELRNGRKRDDFLINLCAIRRRCAVDMSQVLLAIIAGTGERCHAANRRCQRLTDGPTARLTATD